ncbi:putative 2-dehydropantoate 2-reductase protein [Neofusicoccum parvum]|uniref:2-dehydropantoate 2-reductase protein n=1 Tax=Neofusicoccum parvum TaxID=310453 RepID=A0ACB5SPY4_9PEZI|nr:putative 2-dehydropantoate 2-reductase protein [Neofusicoccum parvum]
MDPEPKARVLVVGTGGVGTMACVALERSGGATVTAVLRSNYEQVKNHGFDIESCDHGKLSGWRPSRVVPAVPDAHPTEPFDYIVVTMKNIPEVSNIPDIIRPAVTAGHTAIVLIQNGIGIEQPLVDAFPGSVVLSGVSFIGAHQRNGSVIHDDHDDWALGAFHSPALDPRVERAKAEEFGSIYNSTSADCEVVDDIVYKRWRKVLWNGVFNPMCAITQLDSAAIRRYGGEYSVIRPAMAEMAAIARADGYDLPADIVDVMIDSTPIELSFRPSMLVDVDKGNPMEAEVILGNPLRIARKLGVKTPLLDDTYRMLRLTQARLLAARGLITQPQEIPKADFI